MFGHVVGVGAGKLRGLPVLLLYIYNYITNDYLSAFPVVRWRQRQPGIVVGLQRGRFPSETLGLQTFSQAERDDPPRMDNKTPPKDADFQDISVRILGNWRFGHIWTIFWGYFLVDCQKKSTIFRDRKRSVLKFGVLWGDSEGQTSVVAWWHNAISIEAAVLICFFFF